MSPKRIARQLAFAVLTFVCIAVATVIVESRTLSVRNFSWENATVTWRDRAFELTFSRVVDPASVEANLQIEPPLPGQWEWDGRRAVYQLDRPAPYGLEYQLSLSEVTSSDGDESSFEPFSAEFRSADRAIVYIGTEPDASGSLLLFNLTQGEAQTLTPADLNVLDYRVYPDGDRLLFSAIDRSNAEARVPDVEIYTVTTGTGDEPAGRLERLLDSATYQNLQFDLALDGSVAVIQRASRENPGADFGLWALRDGQEPTPLDTLTGGTFAISPNGRAVAVAQRDGVMLLPLDAEANTSEPVAFFRDFGRALAFSEDGFNLALLKFNPDYTRSIFLSVDLGEPQELLTLAGSVIDAQFDPTGATLYCLLLAELDTEAYLEQPRIVAIDLENLTLQELTRLDPEQRDLQFDLSPDGQAIVFDRVQTAARASEEGDAARQAPRTSSGEPIARGELQAIVPLIGVEDGEQEPTVEPLGLSGIRPRWLP